MEEKTSKVHKADCLNPYSTGNEVVGNAKSSKNSFTASLNPYSTGNEVVGFFVVDGYARL